MAVRVRITKQPNKNDRKLRNESSSKFEKDKCTTDTKLNVSGLKGICSFD